MAENFNLIFGSQAPTTASWSDADYQTGWNTVGSTPPTAEQFDFLQNRADKKAQELNNRMTPLEQKAEEQGRQAGTAYTVGAAVTVDGLPADWLLVCTTAGTSGTVAITLPDPLLDGATINDGTITWTLRKIATNGSLGYRQPSTAYTVGAIAYHSALPTGCYLECITAGTTGSGDLVVSSPAIGDTVTDNTVVWTVCNVHVGAFNTKQTFTSSGSFTAPITGIYKITLQGAGGGGSGCGFNPPANATFTGGGGGQGAQNIFYEKLTAGTTYSFTIGAGGAGGAAGSATTVGSPGATGGTSSITVGGRTYTAEGGGGSGAAGGQGGGKNTIGAGASGTQANVVSNTRIYYGGIGGGNGGATSPVFNKPNAGTFGGGGQGGSYSTYEPNTYYGGGNGGDGYIIFEYCKV